AVRRRLPRNAVRSLVCTPGVAGTPRRSAARPACRRSELREETHMADDKIDKAKGRTKEAMGDLSGDRDLQREGKVDRASGGMKEKLDQVTDKVKGMFRRDH